MFEKLKELVGDNSNALAEIENAQKALQDSTSTINKLEKTNGDLLVEVKKFKEGNSLVKNELGLDELNSDTIKQALSKFKKDDNAEVANLQKQLESVTNDYEGKLKDATGKLNGFVMESALSQTGLAQKAANAKAYEALKNDVLSGATLDGGNIVFKNEDGTTRYGNNGKPYGLSDRVAEIEASEDYAPFLKATNKGGSGTNPSQNSNGQAREITRSQFDGMSHTQRADFTKNGGTVTN